MHPEKETKSFSRFAEASVCLTKFPFFCSAKSYFFLSFKKKNSLRIDCIKQSDQSAQFISTFVWPHIVCRYESGSLRNHVFFLDFFFCSMFFVFVYCLFFFLIWHFKRKQKRKCWMFIDVINWVVEKYNWTIEC